MPPAPDLLELPADRGAVQLLRHHLAPIEAAWEVWTTARDAETLEVFRMEVRRALLTVELFQPWLVGRGTGRLRRVLREVLRRTGPIRQHDAWLRTLEEDLPEPAPGDAQAGVDWLVARLERRRERRFRKQAPKLPDLPAEVGQAMARLDATGDALHGAPPFGIVLGGAVRSLAERLGSALAGAVSPADRQATLRALVLCRRLRMLAPDQAAAPFDDLATALSDMHEFQDLARALQASLKRAGPDHLAGIKWLVSQVEALEQAAWGRAEAAGSGAPLEALLASAHALAGQLEGAAGGELPVEIERKYLLSTVPPTVLRAPSVLMRQGYLPGQVIVERLREIREGNAVRHVRTIKAGKGIARIELQEPMEPALFEALWPLTAGRRLEKRRYKVPEGELTWEVDVFTDREGLVLAEVELPSAAMEPALPFWLRPFVLREVTGDPAWLNSSLAR